MGVPGERRGGKISSEGGKGRGTGVREVGDRLRRKPQAGRGLTGGATGTEDERRRPKVRGTYKEVEARGDRAGKGLPWGHQEQQ